MQLPKLLRIVFIALLTASLNSGAQDRIPVILDADTGNEVDDAYALTRALIEPSWNVLALNATQWQTSHWTIEDSMENSYRLNSMILSHLDLDIPNKRGGAARMYDWGDQAQHSAAAYEIIKQAQAMPEGEKLTVIALGALTNVASAVYIEPSIESKMHVYWLGTTYDFDQGILQKRDFNCVMDIQAIDFMLHSSVEMSIMPVSVASAMKFYWDETERELKGKHPISDFMLDRWYTHLDSGRKERTIWDLALISVMLFPEWGEKVDITTSKDNGGRVIHYYKSIEADKIRNEFFEQMRLLAQ